MTTVFIIIIGILAFCINAMLTFVIVKEAADMMEDIASPRAARVFMRVCLIPPIGIAASLLWAASIIVAAVIMMILESWNR